MNKIIFKFAIPVPSKLELLLAKIFGKRTVSNCMDTFVETYHWNGKMYVTKNWIDENWDK